MEVRINNLTKQFGGFTAVNCLNITMTNGVYGLLGVNGAGKTTLMRMLCTLLHPTDGQITCDGRDIFKMDGDYRKILGYLPQDFGYYPEFTVQDYLIYIAAIKGIRPAVAKKRVKELIAAVGLQKVAHKKMKKLSGGMKRRAGIAQAMLNNPKILILDDSTSAVDTKTDALIRKAFREEIPDTTKFIIAQRISSIEDADKILVMDGGRISAMGTHGELLQSCEIYREIYESQTKGGSENE